MTENEFDIVVVGCGPTGATLANLLGLQQVNVLVLEREPSIYNLPRAVHLDDETMRVFQTIGVANQLQEKTLVNPGMRFIDNRDELILDWPRPADLGKHGWHTSYRLHQPDLENLLRNALESNQYCKLELGQTVTAIKQNANGAQVTYQNAKSNDIQQVNCKYVVGCDGANSFVRSSMACNMEDLGFNERWLVVDVMLKQDMPQLGDHTIQYCDPKQPMTYCRNPGLRRRWEMSLPDSISNEQAVDDDTIWLLLSRWITKDDASVERKAIYTFRSALAKTWCKDRLLLAGDAAHLTPPFMGQGMCTGIRDASNLAWKLSMCLSTDTTQTLLTSYQDERSPHAREYISTAIKLGKLMRTIKQQGTSTSDNGSRQPTRMAAIAPRLGSSHLNKFDLINHCPLSGTLFGQPELADGRLLDEHIGYQPALLIRRMNSEFVKSNPDLKCFAGDENPKIAEALQALSVEAILLRPDRYVFASVTSEEEIEELVISWKMRLAAVMPTSRRG